MPNYEFFCPKCQKEFTIPLTIKEREEGAAKCPDCGDEDVKPLMSSFMPKTSRKS